jgi:hypothetical protein
MFRCERSITGEQVAMFRAASGLACWERGSVLLVVARSFLLTWGSSRPVLLVNFI